MKHFISSALILASVATFGSGCLSAQSQGAVRVAVPFEFVAGSQTFPAGTYIIKPRTDHTMVSIRGESNKVSAIALALSGGEVKETVNSGLTFRHYGGKHFLYQVAIEGVAVATNLQTSAEELKELAARSQLTNIRLVAKR